MSDLARRLTAIAGGVALLVGNLVGLVHVGHHLPAVGIAAAEITSAVPEPTPARSGCSCHFHSGFQEPPTQEANDCQSESPQAPSHDSDCCVICKDFLSSRATADFAACEIQIGECLRNSLNSSDPQLLAVYIFGSPPVRGPPSLSLEHA